MHLSTLACAVNYGAMLEKLSLSCHLLIAAALIALLGQFYETNFRSSIFKLKKFKFVLEYVCDNLNSEF